MSNINQGNNGRTGAGNYIENLNISFKDYKKIEPVNINDLLTIKREETNLEEKKISTGRPKKFEKKLNIHVNINLSEGQLKAIDYRVKKLEIGVRQDYFRKLLRADIPNFDEL